MKLKVHYRAKLLEVLEYTDIEMKQLEICLTKQVEDWHFKRRHSKNPHWDGSVCFLYKKKYIPMGLWAEVITEMRRYNYNVSIVNPNVLLWDVDLNEYNRYITEYFKDHPKKIMPYDYQRRATGKILKAKHCLLESATGSGKTLMLFMIIQYLFKYEFTNGEKILFICPSIDLVDNTCDKYEIEYNHNGEFLGDIQPIYSGRKIVEGKNLVISTYQSLAKKPDNYFKEFDAVFVDEAHKAKASSIKRILSCMPHAKYRIGVTGTIPNDELDYYSIMSNTGPIVMRIKAKDLQDIGTLSNCNIVIIRMDYMSKQKKIALERARDDSDIDGLALYKAEWDMVMASKKRIKFIFKNTVRSDGNQLILFENKVYGKALYDFFRANADSSFEFYYIDGDVKSDKRRLFIDRMKHGKRKIMIASFGTFSTGIDIDNIHAVHLTQSFKSDIKIIQSIGRGLRTHESKSHVDIYDYVDDFRYDKSGYSNIMFDHGIERIRIYESEKYPYKVVDVSF